MATRARKPTLERRGDIVSAVLRIIGERGVTALKVSAIAEEVGVTSGALFRHYGSVDDMLRDVTRHAVHRIDATFPDASLPPVARVLELARNRVRVLGGDAGLAWIVRSEQAILALPSESAEQIRRLVRKSRRYLLTALRQGAREGSIRADIDPEVLLVPVMGTIHALIGMPGAHRAATGKGDRNLGRVLSALERLLAPPSATPSVPRPKRPATPHSPNRR